MVRRSPRVVNDISPALKKINPGTGTDFAIGCHQNVRLGAGIYRIASPVTWVPIPFYGGFPSGHGLIGAGLDSTFLVIATPGNAGLTIGIHNGWGGENWRIKEINTVGDTNCCTYGVAL